MFNAGVRLTRFLLLLFVVCCLLFVVCLSPPGSISNMGNKLCCRLDDDLEYLTEKNSFSNGDPILRGSFADYSTGSGSSVNEASPFAIYDTPENGPSGGRFSSAEEIDVSFSFESPMRGRRKLDYAMSRKPLYFFPNHSIYFNCFNTYVRPYCLGWQTSGVRQSVIAPPSVDERVWVVVNLIAFYNDLCVLTSVYEDTCTEKKCPCMCAGGDPLRVYRWKDEQPNITPTKVSALSYVHRVLDWCTGHFNNPDSTLSKQERIAELYVHLFAHQLHHHMDKFISCGYEHLFKNCLKRFCYFVEFYDVLEKDKLEPVLKWFEHHKERDNCLDMFKYEHDNILSNSPVLGVFLL